MGVIVDYAPRILVANAQQQRRLADATADVRAGMPQSADVGAALDGLCWAKRQFDAEPHYLLAAASHLRDEGVFDEDLEDVELANRLGAVIGDAAMVLRRVSGIDESRNVNEAALISDFYPGAESDPHTRVLLLGALEVMRAAAAELRDGDALVILAR